MSFWSVLARDPTAAWLRWRMRVHAKRAGILDRVPETFWDDLAILLFEKRRVRETVAERCTTYVKGRIENPETQIPYVGPMDDLLARYGVVPLNVVVHPDPDEERLGEFRSRDPELTAWMDELLRPTKPG